MEISDAVRSLDRDLRSILGPRLRSLVVYRGRGGEGHGPTATLALVDGLSADDLRASAGRVASWHDAGLATPLLIGTQEFARSLDAFPYEFGAIIASHAVVSGDNPFSGLRIDPADLRRACEIQARSHLLHLREGYLETRGRSDALADLIVQSAEAFVALVESVTHVNPAFAAPASLPDVTRLAEGGTLTSEQARQLFPDYLAAVEALVHHVDQWGVNA